MVIIATNQKEKKPISKRIKDNEQYLTNQLDIGATNFDVGVRKMKVLNEEIQVYYCNSLCNSEMVILLFRELMRMVNTHRPNVKTKDVIKNHLAHEQVMEIKTLDEVLLYMLCGLIIVLIDGETIGFAVDVRNYPGRTPEEPDVEKVIRGSKDGFVENIILNAGLIRRRVRDENYRNELIRVGKRSKTDVCLSYIKDVANPGLLKTIKKELKQIEIDGIPMGDKTIEEFIVKQGFNPYPLVRYTGRPDVAAEHILEGHIVMIVDTSPSVVILPTTLFHHVQHAEEYLQTPSSGAFLRWVRFIAMLASVFLVPFWYLLVQEGSLLPHWLSFIGPNKHTYHIPIFLQILLAEFGIEALRMAAIHTPTALSTALGLIAAILIGQVAIQVGIFLPEVILYTSISAVGGFATPSYELSLANKMVRVFLIIVTAIFDVPGFAVGTTLIIIFLAQIKNINTPYLWPFIPFNPKALFNIMVRTAMPTAYSRPSIVRSIDDSRQPSKTD
ncbi:spore germination protein [Scopulibacillus cellulosilyticus]|uniref:Spore germination protein n=1 Tax=Scopulibacillus cellulosilyticus TaxID=2665665 RepID=A0ABW2PT82_9BACL